MNFFLFDPGVLIYKFPLVTHLNQPLYLELFMLVLFL